MKQGRQHRRGGFTLMELLTVVAIIAMLMAIFGVGTQKVKIIGRNLQQKSEFHAIRVGLELFSGDFDGYPDSKVKTNGSELITGSQHLAEALLGRDGRGFEPLSQWIPPTDYTVQNKLYTDDPDSLARRKGPYCQLKYGQLLTIGDLWGSISGIHDSYNATQGYEKSPVITDAFARNTSPSGQRVGMPLLYFKGDSTKRFRVDSSLQSVPDASYVDNADYSNWMYNFGDNLPILELAWLRDPTIPLTEWGGHYPDEDNNGWSRARMFYERITQTADPDRNYYKPFNADTFILISAGWDGIYGTKDDIVNFVD